MKQRSCCVQVALSDVCELRIDLPQPTHQAALRWPQSSRGRPLCLNRETRSRHNGVSRRSRKLRAQTPAATPPVTQAGIHRQHVVRDQQERNHIVAACGSHLHGQGFSEVLVRTFLCVTDFYQVRPAQHNCLDSASKSANKHTSRRPMFRICCWWRWHSNHHGRFLHETT